jgi:CheY-like chemotaxis protein
LIDELEIWSVVFKTGVSMNLEDAKILVVDDDNVMRMFIVNLLTRLHVQQVQEAPDGQTGLLKVASFKPDIILSDIHMSPVGGLEFAKQLRAHPDIELRKTPFLLMSADSSTPMLNQSVPLGIAGYIIKPPNQVALKIKLEHALKFR